MTETLNTDPLYLRRMEDLREAVSALLAAREHKREVVRELNEGIQALEGRVAQLAGRLREDRNQASLPGLLDGFEAEVVLEHRHDNPPPNPAATEAGTRPGPRILPDDEVAHAD